MRSTAAGEHRTGEWGGRKPSPRRHCRLGYASERDDTEEPIEHQGTSNAPTGSTHRSDNTRQAARRGDLLPQRGAFRAVAGRRRRRLGRRFDALVSRDATRPVQHFEHAATGHGGWSVNLLWIDREEPHGFLQLFPSRGGMNLDEDFHERGGSADGREAHLEFFAGESHRATASIGSKRIDRVIGPAVRAAGRVAAKRNTLAPGGSARRKR